MEKQLQQREPGANHLFLSNAVIGMSDGLTVPFALAAGLSRATANIDIILIAGITATVAGSMAMGLGGYFTSRSEMAQDTTEALQEDGNRSNLSNAEVEAVKQFYADLGLTPEMQQTAIKEVMEDKEKWMTLKKEYAGFKTKNRQHFLSGITIGLAYFISGLVPLSPYFFISDAMESLKYAAVITLLCLFILGWAKNKLAAYNPWIGALRATITGGMAAGAAYFVASLFRA